MGCGERAHTDYGGKSGQEKLILQVQGVFKSRSHFSFGDFSELKTDMLSKDIFRPIINSYCEICISSYTTQNFQA